MKKLTVLSLAFALVAATGSAFAQDNAPGDPGDRAACAGRHGRHGHRGERGEAGDRADRPAPQAAQASGTITRFIEGRGGRVRAFELSDGTVVRAHGAAETLRVGQAVSVSGFTRPDAPNRRIMRATVRDASGNVLLQPPTPAERAARREAWMNRRGAGRGPAAAR